MCLCIPCSACICCPLYVSSLFVSVGAPVVMCVARGGIMCRPGTPCQQRRRLATRGSVCTPIRVPRSRGGFFAHLRSVCCSREPDHTKMCPCHVELYVVAPSHQRSDRVATRGAVFFHAPGLSARFCVPLLVVAAPAMFHLPRCCRIAFQFMLCLVLSCCHERSRGCCNTIFFKIDSPFGVFSRSVDGVSAPAAL